MESQLTTSNAEKIEINDKKNHHVHLKTCLVAWSAIGFLLITWLSLGLGLGFFLLKYKEQISQYHIQLSEIKTQLSIAQSKHEQVKKHIAQLQSFIQQKFSSNNNTVFLDNVSQLIQLAHYNLIYLHNTDSALQALTLANNQLAEIKSPDLRLEDLRRLLTSYIAKLKAFPRIDLMTALSRLHALQLQILELPLLTTSLKVNPTTASNTESKWVRAIQDSLNSFRKLIVIRRLDKPIKPLLPEAEQQYLQLNLQLLLQQAQWALLHNEPAIYQSSLQQVQEAIQTNFVSDSTITQASLQGIEELKKIDLQTPLDLSPILQIVTTTQKTPINLQPTTMPITVNQKEPA